MPGGRPTKYKPEYVEQAKIAVREFRATNAQLAKLFRVGADTIVDWKEKFPEFSQALKEVDSELDATVEKSLIERATGYSHPAVKIFCTKDGDILEHEYTERYPPDPTSMIFWLKNRQPAKWRDKQELEHSGNLTITVNLTEKAK